MGTAIEGADLPVGTVLPFLGSTAPNGWVLADGSSVSRASYPALFARVGTTYGAVDANTFNVPDWRGRFPIGVDATHALGTVGGSVGHTHTVTAHSVTQPVDHSTHADNIAHTHGLNVQGGTTAATTGTHVMTSAAVGGSARAITAGDAGLSSGTGASLTHSAHSGTAVGNHTIGAADPPYFAVNWIIRCGLSSLWQ